MEGDPYQKIMFAVWTQALHDINRGFLLDSGAISSNDEEKIAEIKENAQDALDWIKNNEQTFELTAHIHNIPPEIFRKKTLELIEINKHKIQTRSKITAQYMYATVSRFRNYDEAFERTVMHTHITVS